MLAPVRETKKRSKEGALDPPWAPKRTQDIWLRKTVNWVRLALLGCFRSPALLTIVTGASENHALPLRRFLRSALDHEPETEVIVYDLGLSGEHRALIAKRFPLRRFDFKSYPPYFDISVNTGEYAWKPTILNEVAAERQGNIVCWMDAGIIITEPLKRLRSAVALNGFYSPIGYWYFGDWVHPGMLKFFNLAPDWRYYSWTLAAGIVAIDTRRPRARKLLGDWARYAAIKECIAPPGSNRQNHRQDQALLTLLAYRAGLVPILPPSPLGFLGHQDCQTQWKSL